MNTNFSNVNFGARVYINTNPLEHRDPSDYRERAMRAAKDNNMGNLKDHGNGIVSIYVPDESERDVKNKLSRSGIGVADGPGINFDQRG